MGDKNWEFIFEEKIIKKPLFYFNHMYGFKPDIFKNYVFNEI